MSGEIDDRHVETLADAPGSFDSIDIAFEANVHEHEIRTVFDDLLNRILAVCSNGGDLVA